MYNNDCVFTSIIIIAVLHSQYLADVSTRPKNFFTFCLLACDGPKQSSTRSEEQILSCSTAANGEKLPNPLMCNCGCESFGSGLETAHLVVKKHMKKTLTNLKFT